MAPETDERLYRFLKRLAVILALATFGWMLVHEFGSGWDDATTERRAADRAFEDGLYARAFAGYRRAEALAPDDPLILRGIALSLMQLGRHGEALTAFEALFAVEDDFAVDYANRGILYDRMGRYQEAMADYRRALSLDAEMVEGPGWLTRFLRNQAEPPPAVADRLAYLQAEMGKPAEERVLHIEEQDAAQRPFKR